MSNQSNHRARLGKADRENCKYYIPIQVDEELEMLKDVGVESLSDLYRHIPQEFRFSESLDLPQSKSGDVLRSEMQVLSEQNKIGMSLIGDGLSDYEIHPVVEEILQIRELATAYTPYQPERSQGTLITQWIYQCGMSALTGFEAINASLYDRSTAIFEACLTSFRVVRNRNKVLISEGIYPGDKEVVMTHFQGTENEVEWIPLSKDTGLMDVQYLKSTLESDTGKLASVCFPQVNCLGLIEPFDEITEICESHDIRTIAVVDPMHLVQGGLKPPSTWGRDGTDFVVGDAQHFAFNPCFGGPGLGVFGVRTDAKRKNYVRNTPGRYVGKAKDVSGRDCFVAVMSAREQHIRRDRATSNICSNQAFIATLAGGAILAYGDQGLKKKLRKARENAQKGLSLFLKHDSFELMFVGQHFVNEFVLRYDGDLSQMIENAVKQGIHLGVDVSNRLPHVSGSLLKVSFHDRDMDWASMCQFLGVQEDQEMSFSESLNSNLLRVESLNLPHYSPDQVVDYYRKLGQLNVSPDNGIYPLGSCTMKYNPEVNEWAAALKGFQMIHPQAPLSAVQGSLSVLHDIQEWFSRITGLPAVTTQPLAGAQGELVGIKLFQAYHDDRGQSDRDIVFIPDTAHGTNFATAVMAGYTSGRRGLQDSGIVVLKTDPLGGIDLADFEEKMRIYHDRLVGIMITNPNTCGVFELNFRKIADRVHEAGGLVYMDGANMNAIAGWVDLSAIGVDAVHNNIHKTWSIPHGGGGPGDGFVAVSEALVDYLPGHQVVKHEDGTFSVCKPKKTIGSFHRHWGNFNHKIRCLTYLKALGNDGIPKMASTAVLSSRYLFSQLLDHYDELPLNSSSTPRMHEFILSFKEEIWKIAEEIGVAKTAVMPGLGKLFLDFGYHAPTVAFPEAFGVMIEPTESYSKAELDRFCEVAVKILELIRMKPSVLKDAPFFTPVDRVDEVLANRSPVLSEVLESFPVIHENRADPIELIDKSPQDILEMIAGE